MINIKWKKKKKIFFLLKYKQYIGNRTYVVIIKRHDYFILYVKYIASLLMFICTHNLPVLHFSFH